MDSRRYSPRDNTPSLINGKPIDTSKLRPISPRNEDMSGISPDLLNLLSKNSTPVTVSERSVSPPVVSDRSVLSSNESSPTVSPVPPLASHIPPAKHIPDLDKSKYVDQNPYKNTRGVSGDNIRYIPPPTNLVHGYAHSKINYSIPDYYTMSLDERMIHRTDLNNKLAALRTIYRNMDIPFVKDSLDPQYLRLLYIQYMGVNNQVGANSSMDMYRFFVTLYLIFLELFVTNVIKIDVSGMSSKFIKSKAMLYYEAAMAEMCESGSISFTDGWPPMIKIAFYGLVQTAIIIILKLLYTWLGPTVGNILEQLLMHIMGTNEPIVNQTKQTPAVPNLNTGIPDVSQSTSMPDIGGIDINSILTGLTGAFNSNIRPTTPNYTVPNQAPHQGPTYKR